MPVKGRGERDDGMMGSTMVLFIGSVWGGTMGMM